MNEDLIKKPRYEFYLGDEVFLKGKIVGFDVDENKCVENVVRLEYGQTLNVPNSNIYTTDNIIDKCKIKVKVPQYVADWIEYCKFTHVDLQHALIVGNVYFYNYANQKDFSKLKEFLETENNQELFARAWLDGYEVEEDKRYRVKIKATGQCLGKYYINNEILSPRFIYTGRNADSFTRKELEEADFGWVFDCEGVEVKELEDE